MNTMSVSLSAEKVKWKRYTALESPALFILMLYDNGMRLDALHLLNDDGQQSFLVITTYLQC